MKKILNENDERLGFLPLPPKKGIIWIILLIVIILLYISYTIYILKQNPILGEYYVVDFENTNDNLSQSEEDLLIKLLHLDKVNFTPNSLEITKIAYEVPCLSESTCYVFFKVDSKENILFNGEDTSIEYGKDGGYIYKHICFNLCTDFDVIEQIVKNHYKWWENNEKNIDESQIYKYTNSL